MLFLKFNNTTILFYYLKKKYLYKDFILFIKFYLLPNNFKVLIKKIL